LSELPDQRTPKSKNSEPDGLQARRSRQGKAARPAGTAAATPFAALATEVGLDD